MAFHCTIALKYNYKSRVFGSVNKTLIEWEIIYVDVIYLCAR